MQFGLVEALFVTVHEGHRLAEHRKSPFRLPDPRVGFRYQRKKDRLPKTGAGGPQIGQTLAPLSASFFAAALLDQPATPRERPHRHTQWKALVSTQATGSVAG